MHPIISDIGITIRNTYFGTTKVASLYQVYFKYRIDKKQLSLYNSLYKNKIPIKYKDLDCFIEVMSANTQGAYIGLVFYKRADNPSDKSTFVNKIARFAERNHIDWEFSQNGPSPEDYETQRRIDLSEATPHSL